MHFLKIKGNIGRYMGALKELVMSSFLPWLVATWFSLGDDPLSSALCSVHFLCVCYVSVLKVYDKKVFAPSQSRSLESSFPPPWYLIMRTGSPSPIPSVFAVFLTCFYSHRHFFPQDHVLVAEISRERSWQSEKKRALWHREVRVGDGFLEVRLSWGLKKLVSHFFSYHPSSAWISLSQQWCHTFIPLNIWCRNNHVT